MTAIQERQIAKFDLRVILSFIHCALICGTTRQEVKELAEHLVQRSIEEDSEVLSIQLEHSDYVLQQLKYSQSLGSLVSAASIDQHRYNKMIDIYGKKHEIQTLQ